MQQDTATPETGPVDTSSTMDSVLAELSEDTPKNEAIDTVTEELVKETEDKGDSAKEPNVQGSATDPIEREEQSEEATPDEAEDDDTPPAKDEPIYKVKVNGEEVDVPLSELQKGYSRTEDYKSKTMALADERRSLDAARANVEVEVQRQYANDLQQTINTFEALDSVLSEARQIDWERLKQEDPATYVQYSDAVQQRLNVIEQHRAKLAHIEQQRTAQYSQEAFAEREQRLNLAANKIVDVLPELKEGDAFQRFATDNITMLRESGFTAEEINDAVDDRVLLLADDARKWRALQRSKAGLPAKKIVPKSSVKPMTTDGADTSRAPSTRMPKQASKDQRIDFVLKELMKGE